MGFQNLSSILLRKCYTMIIRYGTRCMRCAGSWLTSRYCCLRSVRVGARHRCRFSRARAPSAPASLPAPALHYYRTAWYVRAPNPTSSASPLALSWKPGWLPASISGRIPFASHLSPTLSKLAIYTPYLIVPGGCSSGISPRIEIIMEQWILAQNVLGECSQAVSPGCNGLAD